MSSLKYKPSNSSTSSSAANSSSSNLPIWCSLSTPSQIARKYASIAPIWCHISRPRQLKQKFKSTFHQAQSLLTRTHSKDSAANGVNGYNNNNNNDDDSDHATDMHTAINTFKNANKPWSGTNIIPASLSKSKISSSSAYSNYNADSAASELTSILKKRENSLEAKKKDTYYSTNLPQSSTASTRWISSTTSNPATAAANVKDKSTYENASTIVGSFYEENHLPALSSHATDANGGTRRPNKYISKYNSSGKAAGSKTEKIVTKSSKSSPNLLSKDYSDRYDQTAKWQQGNTTNNNQYLHHNHHSSINSPYMSSYTFNQPHMTTSNSNPGAYSSYAANASATNREDKWNELDTMLGAQSALLTRLESDFVANRNKAATKPVTTTTTTTSSSTTTNPTPSVTMPTYQISSKYQQPSELPKTETIATPVVKKKPLKYATSKTEKIIISDEPSVAAVSQFQKFSNRKAEPIIELLNSLELNEANKEKQANSELVDNYNLEIDSKLKTASKHSLKEAAATNGCDNIDDFVDDFVNDYLNNTLKATEAEPKSINKSLPAPIGMSSSLKNINSTNNAAMVNRHTSNTSLASTASVATTNNTSPTNNYNSMGNIVLNTPTVVNLVDNNNNSNNSADNFKQHNWYLFWLIILGL